MGPATKKILIKGKNRKKIVAGQPATRGRWDLPHVAGRPARVAAGTCHAWQVDLPRVADGTCHGSVLAAVAAPWQVRLAGVAGRPATPGRV